MTANPDRVIVTEYDCSSCSVPSVLVQHERFPELRVTDMTARLAARQLANRLATDLDVVSPPSLRKPVLEALEDIREFLEQQPDSARPTATPR